MPPVYVIGHKNPDTDSICAAVAYADLLSRTQYPDAIAAACGTANSRTEWVLDRAGIEHPEVIMDVRPTAGEFCRRNVLFARREEPFMDVYRRMQQHSLKSLPVIDGDRRLIGMVPLHRLVSLILPDQDDLARHRNVTTSLNRLRNVLGGTFAHCVNAKEDEELIMMVGAMNAAGFIERLHGHPAASLLIVTGDRPTVHEPAIEYGVRCIVITGGFEMEPELLERAKKKGVSVIISSLDTTMTTLMIKGAQSIEPAMVTDYVTFSERAQLPAVRSIVKSQHQDLFPVLDSQDKLLGVFSKADLVAPDPARLVLIDHNELSQAVNGADEAQILEVVDHHRIGGSLTSHEPIKFLNDTVGSTSTMIARMYRQQSVVPDSGVALCMVAGIISDTLFLQSPTTTDVDRDILHWLEMYAGVDLDEFSQEFFAVGSVLANQKPADVISSDRKAYDHNGWDITISQVEELGMERFWERKDDLLEALNDWIAKTNYHFACLLITDITKQSSYLLTAGASEVIDAIEYPSPERNLFELTGVVSRKKQLLPQLMWILGNLAPDA